VYLLSESSGGQKPHRNQKPHRKPKPHRNQKPHLTLLLQFISSQNEKLTHLEDRDRHKKETLGGNISDSKKTDQDPTPSTSFTKTDLKQPKAAEISALTLNPKTNPRSKFPEKPEQPDRAFITFIRKHGPKFEAEGAENGMSKAGEFWHKISPALKNKYQQNYLKAKTKHLADLVKYDEKIQTLQMKAEKKRLNDEKKKAAKGK
jgi:hypothetical protein